MVFIAGNESCPQAAAPALPLSPAAPLASVCEVTADPPPFRPTFRLSQTLPVLKEGPPPPLMSVPSAPQVPSGPPASSAGFSIPGRHACWAPPPASPRQPHPWAATVVAQSPLHGPHCPQVPPQSLSRPPASTRTSLPEAPVSPVRTRGPASPAMVTCVPGHGHSHPEPHLPLAAPMFILTRVLPSPAS